MKTMAVAAWKWILIGALVAAIGILLVVGGRRRGTRLYRLRMSLWATVLALLGGGMLMVGCPAEKDDNTATSYKDADIQDAQDVCYAEIGGQSDGQVLCYAPDMSRPDEEARVTCYVDIQVQETKNEVPLTCYAIDVVTPPPDAQEVQVMYYEDVSGIEDLVPTCYKPLPPDALTDMVDAGQPDVPGPTCYAPPPPDQD
ncbi:MAG: hypothetical protein FJ109_17975 [Deltaproteobacteria bacterium]|nr:hypothetical protein [Deltaproteobacteria bacterium]